MLKLYHIKLKRSDYVSNVQMIKLENDVMLEFQENNVFKLEEFIEFTKFLNTPHTKNSKYLDYSISYYSSLRKNLKLEKIRVVVDKYCENQEIRVDFKFKDTKKDTNLASVYCRLSRLGVYTFYPSTHHRVEFRILEQLYARDLANFFGFYQKIDVMYLTEVLDKLRVKYTNQFIQLVRVYKQGQDIEGVKYIPYIRISFITPYYSLKTQIEIKEESLKEAKTVDDIKRYLVIKNRSYSASLFEWEKVESMLSEFLRLINDIKF